jgi:hypothetical protein
MADDPPAGWTLSSWRKGQASYRLSTVDSSSGSECELPRAGKALAMDRNFETRHSIWQKRLWAEKG